jgi:hypothetical protein
LPSGCWLPTYTEGTETQSSRGKAIRRDPSILHLTARSVGE